MDELKLQKSGAITLLAGAVLLAIYNIAFFTLLPFADGKLDRIGAVLSPHWRWISLASFLGVLFMIAGFFTAYMKIRHVSGTTGLLGIIFVELAYLIQACKISWELFLYRPIAQNPLANTLIKDGILFQDAGVKGFKIFGSLIIFAGLIFFCTALYKSRTFSKISIVSIFVGALVYGLGPIFGSYYALWGILVFCGGSFILGLDLLTKPEPPKTSTLP